MTIEEYIEKHNKKFAVDPEKKRRDIGDVRREENLDQILCYKSEGALSKNLEVSYAGKIL